MVEYVLVGGLAGVLHGSPAMTNDADIVPRRRTMTTSSAWRRHSVSSHARLRVLDPPEGIPFDPHPALLRDDARC